MYVPAHFAMPPADARAYIEHVRKATLVTTDPATGRPAASLLPWAFLRGDGTDPDRLTTHLSPVNDQWRHEGPALVIIDGPDAYVDASWLAGYAEGRSAGSWIYETVHVYGRLIPHREPEWIIQSFDDMHRHMGVPHRTSELNQDWLALQATICVGVEIVIEQVIGKAKLAQNRSAAEVDRIAAEVEPQCPALGERLRTVALPHIAAREQALETARQTHARRTGGSARSGA